VLLPDILTSLRHDGAKHTKERCFWNVPRPPTPIRDLRAMQADTQTAPEARVRFKMGALFCVPGRLKSGASGLRPADGLRRPGRRRATVGAKRLQSLSSLGQCTIRQIAPKLKRTHSSGAHFRIGAVFAFLADSSRALQACGQGTSSAVQVAGGRPGAKPLGLPLRGPPGSGCWPVKAW